jgi:hypothetical protein
MFLTDNHDSVDAIEGQNGLLKNAVRSVYQILNTAEVATQGSGGMKWDAFIKVMTDLELTGTNDPINLTPIARSPLLCSRNLARSVFVQGFEI